MTKAEFSSLNRNHHLFLRQNQTLPKEIVHRETGMVPWHPASRAGLHTVFLEIRDWSATAMSPLSKS